MSASAAELVETSRAGPYRWLVWFLGSLTAFGAAMLALPASRLDGKFNPLGNDSFYHARRILDAIADPTTISQFDTRMHAPEGSAIVWPWGFDFLMALIGKVTVAVGLVADPMTALALVAPLAVAISIALVIGIAGRLGVSTAGTAVVVACVALSPLTQALHGVGILDHHFAEYIAWLATLWALLGWLSIGSTVRQAAVAGAVLGFAPALHTDLFILQIPLVAAIGYLRLRAGTLDVRHTSVFASVLVGTTLAILLPSLAFRQGSFEFFMLSWFHLYASVASAAFCLLAVRVPRNRKGVAALLAAALLLALPGLAQLATATQYLAGDLELLDQIVEVKSPFEMASEPGGLKRVSELYSLLIWTAPLVLLGCLFELWRARDGARAVFWTASAFGLALMLTQFRFHNFGSLALYLPLVIWAENLARARGVSVKRVATVLALVMLGAYAPAVRGQVFAVLPPGNDIDYARTRLIYPAFADACRRDPGVVLADSDDGHYIRYHTDCSVIANNFVITRQHEEKLQELDRLMALAPAELVSARPDLDYVFVRFMTLYTKDASGRVFVLPRALVAEHSPRLVRELMLADRNALPAGFEMVAELASADHPDEPRARLFAVGAGE
jgi:hypothetical protein